MMMPITMIISMITMMIIIRITMVANNVSPWFFIKGYKSSANNIFWGKFFHFPAKLDFLQTSAVMTTDNKKFLWWKEVCFLWKEYFFLRKVFLFLKEYLFFMNEIFYKRIYPFCEGDFSDKKNISFCAGYFFERNFFMRFLWYTKNISFCKEDFCSVKMMWKISTRWRASSSFPTQPKFSKIVMEKYSSHRRRTNG